MKDTGCLTTHILSMFFLFVSCFSWNSAIYNNNQRPQVRPKGLHYLVRPVQTEFFTRRGANVTLPCLLRVKPNNYKVKWTKLEEDKLGVENLILITNGVQQRGYGPLAVRSSLRRVNPMESSLHITDVSLDDDGSYRCELINGLEDESITLTLHLEGVVFPLQNTNGRYKYTYYEAEKACEDQDARLATFSQLYKAWLDGLDWCNAGWLKDGTVHYPIIHSREQCGGKELLPGIRSYGQRDKVNDQFDAFCFTSTIKGQVYFTKGRKTFKDAVQSCQSQGAEIATVGQLYAAWHFSRLDRCDGGWLADGSVRFPITTPRARCGGLLEPGVRSFGYPKKALRSYGVYCYHIK
ncbi:hyaluronan and proteoglycan link protein 2 isoform X1 [Erpetoichthys calabaricus]|uniref:Hyaluronan and proteoglycan link protein 2 n=1 Tax=Erpetoichthys calabaricus TaxID=27687 RepID=A0A8C4RES0_ERPCA|nr:hyaluronan and proteoglycan link protein 2 isoform X1 [Erpetoichthys calabaricus]XP_051779269.1 hyaluronan and proteoglycan link protein 2 isoform X1 [Erpetoichthys calabaricus]